MKEQRIRKKIKNVKVEKKPFQGKTLIQKEKNLKGRKGEKTKLLQKMQKLLFIIIITQKEMVLMVNLLK